jgi:Large extracellular alpha-helical protein
VEDYYLGGVDKFEDSVRRDFRDTAFWAPQIITDGQGRATVRFKLPDNLTTWRATARAVTAETAVGSAVHRCTVTKDVMVRLQAPRFFRERDRLTLGVIVHNYTPQRRRIRLSLKASGGSSRVDLQACKLGTGRRFTTS